MYKFRVEKKEEIINKYKLGFLADEIGISLTYLSNILSGKNNCKKVVAYCITKIVDNEKEIEYFFIKE